MARINLPPLPKLDRFGWAGLGLLAVCGAVALGAQWRGSQEEVPSLVADAMPNPLQTAVEDTVSDTLGFCVTEGLEKNIRALQQLGQVPEVRRRIEEGEKRCSESKDPLGHAAFLAEAAGAVLTSSNDLALGEELYRKLDKLAQQGDKDEGVALALYGYRIVAMEGLARLYDATAGHLKAGGEGDKAKSYEEYAARYRQAAEEFRAKLVQPPAAGGK